MSHVNRSVFSSVLLSICLFVSSAAAQEDDATLAIVGGFLIDGYGGPPRPNSVVLVEDDTIVAVGDHLILLDDDGKLTLAAPGPDGLEVHAEAGILSPPALTPPTLQGTILYARDQRHIVALELGSKRPGRRPRDRPLAH